MNDLAGRTALITGVSGAIGGELARTFLRNGARVIGTYRARRLEAENALAHPTVAHASTLVQADIDGAASARDLWRRSLEIGDVDTLVVNAAAMAVTPLTGSDADWDDGWRRVLDVNVTAATTLMREAARSLSERDGGSIIAISSWAAQQGSRLPDLGAYAASKAAMRNFAQTLARAYARKGVRVYTIAPGVVDAGMGTVGLDQDEIAAVADGLAMGRHVDATEIAELAAFLASGVCPSLTGATLDLNGASYVR